MSYSPAPCSPGSAEAGSPPHPSGPLPSMHLSGSRRDQGTSPLHSFSDSQSEESGGEFQPMAFEVDQGTSTRGDADAHNSAPPSGLEGRRDFGQPVQSQQTGASLDQLWQRFSEGRSLLDFHPTNEREPSLLMRLERLSRLLHGEEGAAAAGGAAAGGAATGGGGAEPGAVRGVSTSGPPAETEPEGRRSEVAGRDDGRPRWCARAQQEEESLSPASSHSGPSPGRRHRFPAERDGSGTLSTSRGSASTVDTERLVRAFGSDRVQRRLTPGSPLQKLYHAIHQQREGGARRGEEGEEGEGEEGEGGEEGFYESLLDGSRTGGSRGKGSSR